MTRENNPFECGLDAYCNLDRPIEFMGRAALLGLRAARLALEQAQLPTREAAVVVGSGTGDVETHS